MVDLSGQILNILVQDYNNIVIIIELFICLLVRVGLLIIFTNKLWVTQFTHWVVLELLWTITPIIVLVLLGLPSLKILYLTEAWPETNLNLKVLGHQWYWEYRIPQLGVNFDCYPLLKRSFYRLGETESLILPLNCTIRRLTTSQDVIHSWCLPSLGFKVDACPGRLNYFNFRSYALLFAIGQCSELCGAYHSWIPIKLEFTRIRLFISYLKTL